MQLRNLRVWALASSLLLPLNSSLLIFNSSSFNLDYFFPFAPGGAFNLNTEKYESLHKVSVERPNIGEFPLGNREKLEMQKDGIVINRETLLEFHKNVDASESTKALGDIHSEVKKESNVLEIGKNQEQQFKSVRETVRHQLPSYNSAKEIVLKNYRTPSLSTARTGSAGSMSSQHQFLNKDKRKSILDFYQAYEKMLRHSSSFATQLNQVSGERSSTPSSIRRPSYSNLNKSLQRVGWSTHNNLELKRKGTKGALTISNNYGWGSWDQHPLNNFFDRETDFWNIVKELESSENKLSAYLSNMRFPGLVASGLGPTAVQWVYREKSKYENAISTSRSKIELQIAAKLLEWMDQYVSKLV